VHAALQEVATRFEVDLAPSSRPELWRATSGSASVASPGSPAFRGRRLYDPLLIVLTGLDAEARLRGRNHYRSAGKRLLRAKFRDFGAQMAPGRRNRPSQDARIAFYRWNRPIKTFGSRTSVGIVRFVYPKSASSAGKNREIPDNLGKPINGRDGLFVHHGLVPPSGLQGARQPGVRGLSRRSVPSHLSYRNRATLQDTEIDVAAIEQRHPYQSTSHRQ
jgi:hypothetical protein